MRTRAMRAPDSRRYQSRKKRSKSYRPAVEPSKESSSEANLPHDFRHRRVAILGELRIELAVDSTQRAGAFLHQHRAHLHGLCARQMRDVSVAAGVDSADCDQVEQVFALFEERVRLRERAWLALDCPAGEVDRDVSGEIVGAYCDRDAHRLEQVCKC